MNAIAERMARQRESLEAKERAIEVGYTQGVDRPHAPHTHARTGRRNSILPDLVAAPEPQPQPAARTPHPVAPPRSPTSAGVQ